MPVNRASSPLAALALSLAAGLVSPGCTQRSDSAVASSSVAQAVTTPGSAAPAASGSAVVRPRKQRPRPGIVGLFFRAAEPLDLTASQRSTIEGLEEPLHGASERSAREALRSDLASGVRAGTIDRAKIASDEAVVEKALQADKDARVAALDGLHAVLDTAQRQAVADDVRQSVMQAVPHRGPLDPGDAGAFRWSALRLERLTKHLELDPSQQEQVAALLAKDDHPFSPGRQDARDGARKRIDTLLTAFEQDSFDAGAALQMPGDAGHGQPGHAWIDRESTLLQQLLPILRPEQRDKLAAYVDKPRGFEWNDTAEPGGDSIDDGDWDRTSAPR